LPEINKLEIRKVEDKLGYHSYVLEKVYHLILLMSQLSKLKISDKLVIKGGTAINYIYFKIPRLSEDIDLDYIGFTDREKMQEDRQIIDEKLTQLFKKQGYTVKKKDSWMITKYFLHYTGINNNKDLIKFDINYFKRISVLPIVRKNIKHLFDISDFKVNTYQIEELLATKISAMLSRSTPRDIYDVYNLEHAKFNTELLRKLIVFYASMGSDLRKVNLEAIQNVNSKEFADKLIPQLIKGKDVDINEIKAFVVEKTKSLMKFKQKEIYFISGLYDNKEYNPELLFDNPTLKEHPEFKQVLHKLKNN
jgi:predicted nucleotidyltransferase component of viral defense system